MFLLKPTTYCNTKVGLSSVNGGQSLTAEAIEIMLSDTDTPNETSHSQLVLLHVSERQVPSTVQQFFHHSAYPL